jgi:hypothetical protein
MENGAGPIPLLMGGAASQSALVGGRPPVPPSTASRQGSDSNSAAPRTATPPRGQSDQQRQDRTIESFVRTYLSANLMNMSPKDGWTAAPDRTWTLAGEATDPVLIYSLSGENINAGPNATKETI